MKYDVCVLGLGYIGLPTAAVLANSGYSVVGIDKDEEVLATVGSGNVHIVEPGLDNVVENVVASGKLSVANGPVPASVFIICVPTPVSQHQSEVRPDLTFVMSAAESIAPVLESDDLVILESTSPVGTTMMVKDLLNRANSNNADIDVAYCPERVLPGNVLSEIVGNDRIVGGTNSAATNRAAAFYETFVTGRVLRTNSQTAELCKLTENSFRDVNIAFANELSMICDEANVDVRELIGLANRHPRVNVLQPGVGVGGHCIAVDPWFIVSQYPEQARLVRLARERNLAKTSWCLAKIKDLIGRTENEVGRLPNVALLGLAFKPDIDDLRGSPALEVVESLLESEGNFFLVEPNLDKYEKYQLCKLDAALDRADIVIVLVAHAQFSGVQAFCADKGIRFQSFA